MPAMQSVLVAHKAKAAPFNKARRENLRALSFKLGENSFKRRMAYQHNG